MRSPKKIIAMVSVLVSGAALVLIPGALPAVAQDASTAGVKVGSISGAGDLVVYGTNTEFMPRGINSVGILYPASTAWEMYDGMSSAEQSYIANNLCQGLQSSTSTALNNSVTNMLSIPDKQLLAMREHWQANMVRFHVSEGALYYENQSTSPHYSAYTDGVVSMIQQARAMGLVVDISMDTEPYSCTTTQVQQKMPNSETETAWAQLLQALGAAGLGNDRGIILEPFNEPSTKDACNTGTPYNWQDWAQGCGSYIGMATLGNWLRARAADNVLLFDADNGGGTFETFDPDQWSIPANSAYAIHPFYYTDGKGGWDARFGNLEVATSAHGYGRAVIANAWNMVANEMNTCTPDTSGLANTLVQSYLPEHNIGLSMQSWDAPEATLVSPLPFNGNPQAGDPVDPVTETCNGMQVSLPSGAAIVYPQYWSEAGGSATPAVQVSSLQWNAANTAVNGVNLELADNGSQDGSQPPADIVSSVNVLVKVGSKAPVLVGTMQVTTVGGWDNGTFTSATITGLAKQSPTAAPGDTLVFRVYYKNVSGYTDTDYLVPSPPS